MGREVYIGMEKLTVVLDDVVVAYSSDAFYNSGEDGEPETLLEPC